MPENFKVNLWRRKRIRFLGNFPKNLILFRCETFDLKVCRVQGIPITPREQAFVNANAIAG